MASFVHHTTRDLITVSGPDAGAYLQGQLSQDVARLAVGDAALTFVLAPQGKVEGWGRVHRAEADRFVIDADPGAGESWTTRLRRFLLRTNAEVELAEQVTTTSVRGSETGPAPEGALEAHWPGTEGWDLIGDPAEARAPEGATEIGAEAFTALRIRAGVPRWGTEIDADTIPATLGQWLIDASVSFTKGCYTGQELVARIDSRGSNVPRRLAGAVVEGDPIPVGSEVRVGEASSLVTSSASGGERSVALLFLPRSVETPADGEADGRPIRLVDLPMA